MEDSVGAPSLLFAREVGDQGSLGAFGRGEEKRVEPEDPPDGQRARNERESQVGEREDRPPERDRGPPADPIRQGAAGNPEGGLRAVEEGPEQGQLPDRDPAVPGAQEKEGVGRIGEREEAEDPDDDPESSRKARRPLDPLLRRPGLRSPFGNAEEEKRDRQEGAFLTNPETQEQGGGDRAGEGPGVVHRALESEGPPPVPGGGEIGQQGIAGGSAQAFPEPVGKPDRQDLRPGSRDADERPGHGGQRVAGHDERLAPMGPVRPPTRPDLGQRRRGLGHAFDQAEHGRTGSERPREEVGQERIDHLGGRVVQEGDPAEHHHSSMDTATVKYI